MKTQTKPLLCLPSKESKNSSTPMYAAKDLTKAGDVAHISLQEKIYILRITRAGKLILTK